ncbi:MAG: threonine synthase [Oscillospiraceae bacterium]|nr:threonine synthase [Oscillospiraceae bacterium]
MTYQLVCSRCGSAAEREPAYKCTRCGGILTFHYGFRPGDYRVEPEKPGIFRFSSILPVQNVRPAESLGEGGTPLLPSAAVGPANGLERVYFKLDSLNPSGSFKDRALAVAMNCVNRFGLKKMIIASSGNASAAAAAYAARAGVELIAVVPDSTPANKTRQAMCHGAQVVKVPGNYSRSYALCREMAETYGWFDMTTTFINPYAREGYKTIGYEIFEQLGRRVPDAIVLPTGAGPILAAVWQAFVELEQLGLAERMPKLVCVQAKNCGPIAGAFLRNAGQVEPCADAQPTLASGINDSLMGYADDGDYTLACIRRSGGTALLLDEEEIRQSVRQLCREGVFAEPAGAVSAAAIARLARSGFLQKTDTVVGVVTGHGLKNPLELEAGIPTAASAAELARILEEG